MSFHTEMAKRSWDHEVDLEAARLIEAGTPPMQAAREAVDIVSRRRRGKQAAKRPPVSGKTG